MIPDRQQPQIDAGGHASRGATMGIPVERAEIQPTVQPLILGNAWIDADPIVGDFGQPQMDTDKHRSHPRTAVESRGVQPTEPDEPKADGPDAAVKYEIIGCAMEVLNELGHGLHEKPYERVPLVELKLRNHRHEQQRRFTIVYQGFSVARHLCSSVSICGFPARNFTHLISYPFHDRSP